MMKAIPSLILFACGLFLSSCASNTPQTRIEKSPEVYQGLSNRDKQLASQGQIAQGMSREGVYLAWGSPSSQSTGERQGQTTERWDYTGTRPSYRTFLNGWGGYGWGRHHGYRGGFGISPVLTYENYRKGTVWFRKGKVSEWEKIVR